MSDTTTIAAQTRFVWKLSISQISIARALAKNWRGNYGDTFSCSAEFIQELCCDALSARDALEQAEARAEKCKTRVETLRKRLMEQVPYTKEILARAEKTEAENARLRAELETAKQVAASAQAVAQEAWAGEIPSPLPGHKRANEEELLAQVEHLNCPLCGGSGHIGDCEGD